MNDRTRRRYCQLWLWSEINCGPAPELALDAFRFVFGTRTRIKPETLEWLEVLATEGAGRMREQWSGEALALAREKLADLEAEEKVPPSVDFQPVNVDITGYRG